MSEIRMFAGDFAPKNWALCWGQTLAISTNQALFSLLGTTYGGNGVNTFMLPNFTGRAAAATGNSAFGLNYLNGSVDGTQQVTLTINQLPTHTHTGIASVELPALSEAGNSASPTNNNISSAVGLYTSEPGDIQLKPFNASVTILPSGNNLPVPIMQPYLALNFVICIYGIFPSRN